MRACHHLFLFLLLFLSLSVSAHTVTEKGGYYRIEHTWAFEGKQCSISLGVSTQLYNYYKNEREHLAYRYQFNQDEIQPNYYGFMLSEYDRPVVREMARLCSELASSELEQVKIALSFVQSLPYAFDSDSKGEDEYVRYPVETLVDGCGDCEDKVALLSAILYEMDADFMLLIMPEHMALGVHCSGVMADRYLLFREKKYYYMETTMPNWKIGQIPEEYHKTEMEVVPLNATPTLLMKGVRFKSDPSYSFEKANCELQIDLDNLGPGKVSNMMLRVRVIEKGAPDRLLSEEYFILGDILEGASRTERLSMKSLIKANGVLEVELTGTEVDPQYYQMELSYSKVRRQ